MSNPGLQEKDNKDISMLEEDSLGKFFEVEETSDQSAIYLKVRLFPSDDLLRQFTSDGVY